MVTLPPEKTSMTKSTIFDRMRQDHRIVLERVAALEQHQGEIGQLVEMLERQFGTHMAGEDRVIFP
jgi:iron-sulfur cluster repair protein YtfE (RIC family)